MGDKTPKKHYTIVFIDALFVKIRRDKVASDAIYLLAGIDEEGYRDILFNRWIDKIEVLMTFLEFLKYLRLHIYSTNWLERLNKEFKKSSKPKTNSQLRLSFKRHLFQNQRFSHQWVCQRLNGFVFDYLDLQILWEKYYQLGKEVFTQPT